jgi:hypothetical protein
VRHQVPPDSNPTNEIPRPPQLHAARFRSPRSPVLHAPPPPFSSTAHLLSSRWTGSTPAALPSIARGATTASALIPASVGHWRLTHRPARRRGRAAAALPGRRSCRAQVALEAATLPQPASHRCRRRRSRPRLTQVRGPLGFSLSRGSSQARLHMLSCWWVAVFLQWIRCTRSSGACSILHLQQNLSIPDTCSMYKQDSVLATRSSRILFLA